MLEMVELITTSTIHIRKSLFLPPLFQNIAAALHIIPPRKNMMDVDVRGDGRTPNQLRPLTCSRNLLNRAHGSARWSQGDTTVLAAVFGPKAGTKKGENPEKASIEVIWKPKTGQIGRREKEYEMILRQTLQSICLLTVHPNTTTSIIVQVIGDDGALLSCAINASCVALVDAGFPLKHLAVSICCGLTVGGHVILDPTVLEEQKLKAVVHLVFPNPPLSIHHKTQSLMKDEPIEHGIITSVTRGVMSGGQGDQYTTEGTTSSPSRVRAREPSPSYANVPSSGRRRVRSRPMEPPRASADWTASPLPQQLLPQDEVPFDSYRMSVDARHIPFDDYEGGLSSTRVPSPIPEAGSSFMESLFSTAPYSSYWPGETSAARESPPTGGFSAPEYTPTFFELVPVVEAPFTDNPPAHFVESSTVPEYEHCLDRGRIACTKISEFVRRNLQSLAREGLARAT